MILSSSRRGAVSALHRALWRSSTSTPTRLALFSSTASTSEDVVSDYTPLFSSNVYSQVPEYRKLMGPEAVETVQLPDGQTLLQVKGEALRTLSRTAFADIAHLLRPAHLQQLRNILDDAEASSNDHFVALELLKNANIASAGVLPGCQDTGTAIVLGKKGHLVLTDGHDEAYLSAGAADAYRELNLRYSQVAPVDMFQEKNTGNNLPAQIDLLASPGQEYKFMFIAKGGGSANKTFLYQQTKALLNPGSLETFLENNIKTIGMYYSTVQYCVYCCHYCFVLLSFYRSSTLTMDAPIYFFCLTGTSACPPYHL